MKMSWITSAFAGTTRPSHGWRAIAARRLRVHPWRRAAGRSDAGERGEAGGGDRRPAWSACARRAICSATGTSVFIVEAGEPGHGASFGNAGAFNASSVTPVSMPGVMWNVPRWLVRPVGAVVAALVLSADDRAVARPLYPRRHAGEGARAGARPAAAGRRHPGSAEPLVHDAGAEELVHRFGHLYVYRSAQGPQKDRLAWELRRENGVEIDEFDADGLRQLEPTLSRDYVRGILVRENGHTSNPLALVQRLLDHFLRSGGELKRARASGFRPRRKASRRDPHRPGRLPRRRRGGLRRRLVEAARRRARRPYPARNRARLPFDDPRPGGHAAHPDRRRRRQVRRDADGYRAALCRHGRAGRPAAPPDWRRARILLEQGRRMLPGPAAVRSIPKTASRCGWAIARACPIHCRRSAPRVPAADVIYAFGHGHVGMTSAPMTGKVVADLVAGRPPSIDIAAFAPSRFA